MAIAHVQTQGAAQGASTSISVTITLTAGNAVVVVLMQHSSADPPTGLAQTAGDTLTKRYSSAPSGEYVSQWTNYSVAGGATTFTFTWTSSLFTAMYVMEISGMASGGYDVSAVGSFTVATTHDSGTTATLAQADEIAISQFNADGSGPTSFTSVNNGYTVPTNGSNFSNGAILQGGVAYLVTSATTGQTVTWTTQNCSAVAQISTYKELLLITGWLTSPNRPLPNKYEIVAY